MKEMGIKERISDKIAEALINCEPIKEFYIKLLTSSSEIDEDDIADAVIRKRLDNKEIEERFPTRYSIVLELTKHVIATKNSQYIYHFANNKSSEIKEKLSDAIISTKDYQAICSFASSMCSGIKVNKFVDIIIEYGDVGQIYHFIDNSFCCERNIFEEGDNKHEILDKLVDAIIQKSIQEQEYYLLTELANLNIRGVSVSKLEDAIISMDRGLATYHFAYKVEKSDKDKLEKAIIKSSDLDSVLHFATDIKGVDINLLFDAIVESDNDYYFDRFIEEVPGLSKDKIIDGIIKKNYFSYIYDNNLKLTRNQMHRVADKIVNLDAAQIFDFASNMRDIPKKKLVNAVIKTGDAEFIYKFATRIQKPPLDRFEEALITIGDPRYIFLFAKAVVGIDTDKYADALIKAGDVYWMYRFASEIKFAPVEKLEKAILELAK